MNTSLLFNILLLVNDGSGKVPAYRELVDAVQSIIRTNGVKGLFNNYPAKSRGLSPDI